MEKEGKTLPTTYSSENSESLVNAIKNMPWYEKHKRSIK